MGRGSVGSREHMPVEVAGVELGVFIAAVLSPAIEHVDGARVEVD